LRSALRRIGSAALGLLGLPVDGRSPMLKSMVCRYEHFLAPWYEHWAVKLGVYDPGLIQVASYRKYWEYCAIAQALAERGMLARGRTGCGFAVGKEPLVSLFASFGATIWATDLASEQTSEKWMQSGQHADGAADLYRPDLLTEEAFRGRVNFRHVDMRDLDGIPGEVFDFMWSSCAFEHLGTLQAGMDFVANSARLLKPGGVAVHTTEYNVSSNEETVTSGAGVIYRRQDLEKLRDRLRQSGCAVAPFDYDSGEHPYDLDYDVPPYYQSDRKHIKLLVQNYVVTSSLIIIRKSRFPVASLVRSGIARALPRVSPASRSNGLAPEAVATALYRGMLGREPDLVGLGDKVELLRSGRVLEEVIRTFVASPEFRSRELKATIPTFELPDLTRTMPQMYRAVPLGDRNATVYTAQSDADIADMATLIERHRYYDAFGVWSPVIDLDKAVTAAIVRGLGARSCFELGCFTGPVLSLLAEAGISIAGSEVSHTAFTFAYPNVRDAMLFGDLLDLEIDGRFDVILGMDVLEHLNPLEFHRYIEKIATLLADDGYVYINSPMYGDDPIFGTVFGAYLDEWLSVGDRSFWRHWPCDDKGWPEHGHLVWADVKWWSRMFEAQGLVRDEAIERVVHRHLAGFFETAPARRALFVLRRPGNTRSAAAAAALNEVLGRMPGLPRTHP
jgi:SAM-dependent methyltransferase